MSDSPSNNLSRRRLPVCPDAEQLRHQAKELLRDYRAGTAAALAEFAAHHSPTVTPASAKLADAQLVLARSYDAPSWARLMQACAMANAIWEDDINTVRELVQKNPALVHEPVRIRDANWGPPLTYAANVGRDDIIKLLYAVGARDLLSGIGRATLQGKIATARMLYEMAGSPPIPEDALGDSAYTLSVSGTEYLFEIGAKVHDANGNPNAPVAVVIESDSRKPAAKHRILELYVEHGLELPDTPVMALHRGRIDLLEKHLRADALLLTRTFTHNEIFPTELGCRNVVDTQGTPLAGTTLLHMCVDFDELEIANWLLQQGMPVDAPAAIDADGFGGHTALFGAVVCYANFWRNYHQKSTDSPFAELLLKHGANANAVASLRKALHDDETRVREYHNVNPYTWGQQFDYRILVSEPAMQLVAERQRAQ